MRETVGQALWQMRLAAAFAWSLPLYWLEIFPQARRELRAWEQRARRIPDPVLRAHALRKLRSEAMTAEGAAAFAILSPASARHEVVRACVAFEVIYDYSTRSAEEPVADALADNRLLYGALVAAFAPSRSARRLVRAPSAARRRRLSATARRRPAATRCWSCPAPRASSTACTGSPSVPPRRRASSIRHGHRRRASARALGGDVPAARLPPALVGAGGSGRLAARLLRPRRGGGAARHEPGRSRPRSNGAYFPWIAALSWLLESFVDRDEDEASGMHSYIAPLRVGAERGPAPQDDRRTRGGRRATVAAGRPPHVAARGHGQHVPVPPRSAGQTGPPRSPRPSAPRSAVIVTPLLHVLRLRCRLSATGRARRPNGRRAARRRWRRRRRARRRPRCAARRR